MDRTLSSYQDKINTQKLEPGWLLYRLNTGWVTFRAALFGALSFVSLVFVGGFLHLAFKGTEVNFVFLLLSIFFGLGMVWCAIEYIISLRYLFLRPRSWILLTLHEAVCSRFGLVTVYPYGQMTQLRLVSNPGVFILPSYRINFIDALTGSEQVLVKGRVFGDPQMIYQVLTTRV